MNSPESTPERLGLEILSLLEEIEEIDQGVAISFWNAYPQLNLSGDEWLDFCSQKCAMDLYEELEEAYDEVSGM